MATPTREKGVASPFFPDFVFLTDEGKQWTRDRVQRQIEKLRKHCDIPPHFIACNVFRHTFGSCITKMQGIGVAAEYLGHSDIKLTRQYYANVMIPYAKMGDEELPYNIPSDYLQEMAKKSKRPKAPALFKIVTSDDLHRMAR